MTGNVLVVSARLHILSGLVENLEELPEVSAVDADEIIEEAEEHLRAKQYELAIIDPYISGFLYKEHESPFVGLVEKLAQERIPVIIYSTYCEDELQRFDFERGRDYAKFCNVDDICDTVAEILRAQQEH